jgi:hypothetical protein
MLHRRVEIDKQEEGGNGSFDRGGAPKPRLVSGVKGRNIKESFFFGEPRRACPVLTGWTESFTFIKMKVNSDLPN